MSEYTTAVLAHGLIVTGGGGSFPSPYDVRFGIDNGNGEIGTLVIPATLNVRLGITYGGDGTQYTGTLYAPTPGYTWTADALSLWEDLYAEFGNEFTFNGITIRTIANPVKSANRMTINAYDKGADTILDSLRTEVSAAGLYTLIKSATSNTPRPQVTFSGSQYEILGFEDDNPTQPSIRMSCALLK